MYKKIAKGFALFMIVAAIVGIFYYMTYLNNHDGQMKGTLVNTCQMKENEERI